MSGIKINKLILGTAQFGLNYGINNKKGKLKEEAIDDILTFASKSKIKFIDTAQVYGDCESRLGKSFIKNGLNFELISKLSSENVFDIIKSFMTTLNFLKQKTIYGFLVHDFEDLKTNNGIWNTLVELKNRNLISKIGVSVYFPKEIDYLLEKNIKPDIIQFPYSVFDRRFEPNLQKLKGQNIELHARSVFLQGLVFVLPDSIDPFFEKIKGKLNKLHEYSNSLNISISSICLNFAMINKLIDKVIIGVDSLCNLKDNVESLEHIYKIDDIYSNLLELEESDEKIILPFNW